MRLHTQFPQKPEEFTAEALEIKDLGDMVICPEVLQRYCSKNRMWFHGDFILLSFIIFLVVFNVYTEVTWEEHLPIILTHGVVHLIGYDHVKEEDYQQMAAKEESILAQFRNIPENIAGTRSSRNRTTFTTR